MRKGGGRVRITAQLIDTTTGAHLWADRFDGSLQDVFDLQDKVASSVAGVIEPALRAVEIRRASERETRDLTAYDLYLRALAHSSGSKAALNRALDLLEQAIDRDRHYGPALARAAFCRVFIDLNGWTSKPPAMIPTPWSMPLMRSRISVRTSMRCWRSLIAPSGSIRALRWVG